MKSVLVSSAVLGVAASAMLWLTSERCEARFSVDEVWGVGGCENKPVFHLHEPTEETERRARRGDRIRERITAFRGIPVAWIRVEIRRNEQVVERFSVGSLPYFGTVAAAAAAPLLCCLAGVGIASLVRPRKPPG